MIHKIDLHGLTHKEAISKVENELIGISMSNYWEVEIITGKSGNMRDIICKEVLDVFNFFYYIPSDNPGVIIVVQDAFYS